jgi:uncharacterized protein (DUF2336 family)
MKFQFDVKQLRNNPSTEVKRNITEQLVQHFNSGQFEKNEANLAIEVMNLLAQDSEIKIRKTLSDNLKDNTAIPHALALRLAKDVAEVAVPMLEVSILLTQEDLISIVKSSNEISALTAIADRKDVSGPLSGALIDTSHAVVVNTLVNNKDAHLSADHISEVMEKFAKSGTIIEALVNRGTLPVGIVERMLEFVSDELKGQLIKQYKVSGEMATDIMAETNEQATLDLLCDNDNERVIQQLIDYLHKNKKLTQSIILRALCKGDFVFFERGLAKLSDTSIEDAHAILYEEGATSFAALYKSAGMPHGAFAAVNVIWRFALEEINRGTFSKNTYANRMIEYITEKGFDKKITIMHYFMILLKSKVANDDSAYRFQY